MPFETPITIKAAVTKIHQRNYLLPRIQRSFVWAPEQIEKLFDSLMRGYPISSFLFWEVDRGAQSDYEFYEFIQDFHEVENKDNKKANVNGEQLITAVLDGQQRLTSLYIGLRGSYSYKLSNKRKGNPSAYPRRKLCLNLISTPNEEESDLLYEFSFLTDDDKREVNEDSFWFEVGAVLDFEKLSDVTAYVRTHLANATEFQYVFSQDKIDLATERLSNLFQTINKTPIINYFLEKNESLDRVLEIFIRINSGGTQLSYSDLLLSTASAVWKQRDAREEINHFVKELCSIGSGFDITKDFVLKCSLALTDREMAFKMKNFNSETMLDIENRWDAITSAIRAAVNFVADNGYHRDNLTSNNALIPIAYFLKKINSPKNFSDSHQYVSVRKDILTWLRISILKRLFSGQPDNVLRPIRDILRSHVGEFPLEEMKSRLRGIAGGSKSLDFDELDLEGLLSYEYGEPYTYSVLALLYPAYDFKMKFDQDHIFAKKFFKKRDLEKFGFEAADVEFCMKKYNCIANLQLLPAVPNQEKSAKKFEEWLFEYHPDQENRKQYLCTNLIPDMQYEIKNFPKFIRERENMLKSYFRKLLKIS